MSNHAWKPRRATEVIREHLETFRVVVVEGPRQAGKTTILRQIEQRGDRALVTFDDGAELQAAIANPRDYLAANRRPLSIDEFQRAGNGLLLAIKLIVDRNDTRGQFLLAGSTTFLTTRQLSESLAGRVGLVRVWPFTQGELRGVRETFLDVILDDPAALVNHRAERLGRDTLARMIVTGGYPEAVAARSDRARRAFFQAYLSTVVSREAQSDAGERRDPLTLRRTLDIVASRTSGEMDISGVARDAAVARDTVAAHLAVLETIHQVLTLPPWASSAATRAKRRRKVVVSDSGVAAALLGVEVDELLDPRSREFGRLLETFVIGELVRQAAWNERCSLSHYRDRDGREVDLVIEGPGRRLVGIEIKAADSPGPSAAGHLRYLADRAGDRWRGGIVLYPGELSYSLGDRVWAVPIAALWAHER